MTVFEIVNPSIVCALIVDVPHDKPVSIPFEEIVAIDVSDEFQQSTSTKSTLDCSSSCMSILSPISTDNASSVNAA